MINGKDTFNVLESIEKHIEALKPLLPKQALVCVGEYPIKTVLKEPGASREAALPVFIEKSSDEIYKWLPKGYKPQLVLGFEDAHIDTHFWYNILPAISKDKSVMESLDKKSVEKLHGAVIFASVWDGIGSAALPVLIGKFRAANMDSFSIAVLPSKIQPTDAHFNTCGALEMCLTAEGAAVLLMDRDCIENYEGVDRKGELIKGNMTANYLLNLFLAKDTIAQEISELARTFNTTLFAPIVVTGASYKIYGSVENMLDAAVLKPFLTFDLSTASLLYVVLRMPISLKDTLPRGKIELAVTNWFKDKADLKSIYITEPVYTEDMTDRIDAVLFVGGFDTSRMLSDLEQKVAALKSQAVERGFITEDWQVVVKPEAELKAEEAPKAVEPQTMESPKIVDETALIEAVKTVGDAEVLDEAKTAEPPISMDTPETAEPQELIEIEQAAPEIKNVSITEKAVTTETPATPETLKTAEEPKSAVKPKRARRTKKTVTKKKIVKTKVE